MSDKSNMLNGLIRKPYGLLESTVFKWLFVLTGPILSFLYVIIKKPKLLGLLYSDQEVLLITMGYSLILCLIWVVHLFGLQRILIKKFTFLKTLLWILWINLISGLFNFVFVVITLFEREFDWYFFPEILTNSLYFGGGIAFLYILVYAAKENLSQANS